MTNLEVSARIGNALLIGEILPAVSAPPMGPTPSPFREARTKESPARRAAYHELEARRPASISLPGRLRQAASRSKSP